MIALDTIEHMRDMLDAAEKDPRKRRLLECGLINVTAKLARTHQYITVEMVAEKLVDLDRSVLGKVA